MEAARVLIIDDDDLTLTVLRKMLEADGYEVDTCTSGSQALSLLLHNSVNAILCDMWMNGMTGKDFYLKLKQGFPEYQRRVVFITGDIASETTWEFIDERQLPYVIKPISRPLLRRKLREIIGEPSASAISPTGSLAWDGVERRRRGREAGEASARLRAKDSAAEWDTVSLINAGPGGIYVLSEREYSVGSDVTVAYPLTEAGGQEQEGYVIRVELRADGKQGVAVALGEEAVAARLSHTGIEPGPASADGVTTEELPPEVLAESLARLGFDEEAEALRRERELEELRRTHDEVLDQRDRLIAEQAEMRRKLQEMADAEASMSLQMSGLRSQMEGLQKEQSQLEEVRHKATHDALTGIWNRGAILDVLRKEMGRARREKAFVGVLLGDLDHFKVVNDTHGHLVGDAVLREAAQRISVAVRSYDSVGRYGGEEFLIILSGCEDDVDILRRAERIRAQVAESPVSTNEGSISVTLSLGVASSSDYQEVEEILRAADAALYRAKRLGRNRVEASRAPESPAA